MTEPRYLDRPMVSILKACALVDVSRRTLYNWMSSGKVEFIRTAGGSVRIFKDSLFRSADGKPLLPKGHA